MQTVERKIKFLEDQETNHSVFLASSPARQFLFKISNGPIKVSEIELKDFQFEVMQANV